MRIFPIRMGASVVMTDKMLQRVCSFERLGWRWRLGPSACGEDEFYVAHVWHMSNPKRVVPVTNAKLHRVLDIMGEIIHKMEAERQEKLQEKK